MFLKVNKSSVLEKAFSHLTSRDPAYFWTSGQWMTEKRGNKWLILTLKIFVFYKYIVHFINKALITFAYTLVSNFILI